jgi:hypothetical protein
MESGRPNLSFVVPGASENRWSDLLATLIATDPGPLSNLLGIDFDAVHREVSAAGASSRVTDRLDLLLTKDDRDVVAIEAKILSDLGPRQLERYEAAFPAVSQRWVLQLRQIPLDLRAAPAWRSLTWEDVLAAYAVSSHAWVATTASAWLSQLAELIPPIDAGTVWNDVPDGVADMELALRARVAWLYGRLTSWCTVDHDMTPASGGGNWAIRLWSRAADASDHLVTAEFQEGMTAYEWRPRDTPYRERLQGPVVIIGLRQDGVTTSADFDWDLLHKMFTDFVLEDAAMQHWDWQRTSANPRHAIDKQNWQAMVAAGAPRWLGKGWGMKVARDLGSCLFGARIQLPPTKTLGELERSLHDIERTVQRMARSREL